MPDAKKFVDFRGLRYYHNRIKDLLDSSLPQEFQGANASEDGGAGLVPSPEAADRNKFLKGDGTWSEIPNQTNVSGNASTAAEFSSAQTVELTGDVTGNASSTAGWTVATTLANSGVTAGTYRSVAVNAKGLVTGGTNPTTLAGYEISDAGIANGVITLGNNTITPLTADSAIDAAKLSGTASIDTTGNAATATKATQDASGNVITTTYATKSEMPADYVGATSSANGTHGLVPAATSAEKDNFLAGDGTWTAIDTISDSQIDDLFFLMGSDEEEEDEIGPKLIIQNNGYLKITFYTAVAGSGMEAYALNSFDMRNFVLYSNVDYELEDVVYTDFDFATEEDSGVNGLVMTMLCKDENGVDHFYSCVGGDAAGCSNSEYATWRYATPQWDGVDYWNSIDIDGTDLANAGDTVTYWFNYSSTGDTDKNGSLQGHNLSLRIVNEGGVGDYHFYLRWNGTL